MSIYETLQNVGLPCAYSHFRGDDNPTAPPYLVYTGNGQRALNADNTRHWRENAYKIEYYFTEKNEETEARIEDAILDAGYVYTKSEDVYINGEDVFVIYYQV